MLSKSTARDMPTYPDPTTVIFVFSVKIIYRFCYKSELPMKSFSQFTTFDTFEIESSIGQIISF